MPLIVLRCSAQDLRGRSLSPCIACTHISHCVALEHKEALGTAQLAVLSCMRELLNLPNESLD